MALSTSISGYYKFDESSGNASDSVGSNTLTNTSCTYTTGKINNGVSFGTKMVSSSFPSIGTGDFTYNLWYKSSTTGTNKQLSVIGNSAQSTNTILYLYTTTGNAIQLDTAGAGIITSSNTSSLDGNWHMLTITKTGDNFVMYIDNASVGTGTRASINLGTNVLSVGYDNPNSRWSWVGMLDELGIWARALSGSEITELYNSGSGSQYPFSTSVTVSATVQSATFTIPAYTTTATRNITVSATVLTATFSVQSATEIIDESYSPPQPITATFSIPTYSVTADGAVTVNPSVQVCTFTIPSYTVTAIAHTSVSPSVQVLTFTIPAYTETVVSNITISPSAFSMLFSIPIYTALGDYWEEKYDAVSTSWSDKLSVPSTSWGNKY